VLLRRMSRRLSAQPCTFRRVPSSTVADRRGLSRPVTPEVAGSSPLAPTSRSPRKLRTSDEPTVTTAQSTVPRSAPKQRLTLPRGVNHPDGHHFDGDRDGVGCET
jgi:hypothetical protein